MSKVQKMFCLDNDAILSYFLSIFKWHFLHFFCSVSATNLMAGEWVECSQLLTLMTPGLSSEPNMQYLEQGCCLVDRILWPMVCNLCADQRGNTFLYTCTWCHAIRHHNITILSLWVTFLLNFWVIFYPAYSSQQSIIKYPTLIHLKKKCNICYTRVCPPPIFLNV